MAGPVLTGQFRGSEIWLKKSGKYSRREINKNKLQICIYMCMCISSSYPLSCCAFT